MSLGPTTDHSTATATATKTRRSTLYLLRDTGTSPEELRSALNPKYERDHSFVVEDVMIEDTPALLCHGVIGRHRPPDWTSSVHTLTGRKPPAENHTSACVLLLPVADDVFALTFGMGHLLLDQSRISPGFGFDFVLRAAQPDAIRQVTHSLMDARGRTDRSSAALGQHIRAFAIEEYGEVVSRLVGTLGATELTISKHSRRTAQVAGTDALKIHLGAQPEDLVQDLAHIQEILDRRSPAPEFEAIARVRPLKSGDPRRSVLQARLDVLLGAPADTGSMAVAVPAACLDQEDAALSYRVKIGSVRRLVPSPTIEDIRELLDDVPPGRRLEALSAGYVQMHRDEEGTDPVSAQVRAHKWITAEIPLDTSRYFHHEGRWFEIGDHYLEGVRAEVDTLLAAPASCPLPPWRTDHGTEEAYNLEAAESGYLCLDRQLIRTAQHPHGFEAADLLAEDGTLVHVKRAASSAPLSHLFAQGRVSAEALRFDAEARAEFVRRVREQHPGHPISQDFTPRKVVYAVSLKSGKTLTTRNLFTFAQVSLLQAVRALRTQGIDVAVVDIPSPGTST
ncbi:TIGR04141 family sporadically distributed protein [Streptomyces sp. MUM 203J]|uniref:DUF6119 family protein n=1 Tax=Streptomyces sp. MUM 203J TaxID=2791990 RepID=UPI001F03C258|nr:DUF6119 family protein [Streptomyces sp. MUM 203J]MCH0538160.1 TIGR04141 family sporadically distributed protein [Streptomyces sp. MUM 203J]